MQHFSLSHPPPGILCLQHQPLLLKSASLPDKMTKYVKAVFEKYLFLICDLSKIVGKAFMLTIYTGAMNCNKKQ